MSQTQDLNRALLRPTIIHILRAAGFHSTRPSVLDTVTNIAERYLVLLAATTAQHAYSSHNDHVPDVSDVRMALSDCGSLIPLLQAGEEGWLERMRRPIEEIGLDDKGGKQRVTGEKRKREEDDVKDITDFKAWVEGPVHAEARRIAGLVPDASTTGVIGVGGGLVQGEDWFHALKKKYAKAGGGMDVEDGRLAGTVLGKPVEDREVLIDGGPVQRLKDWRPKIEKRANNVQTPTDEDDRPLKQRATQA
ncbi:hypothetical protein K431DRAFT_317894 [Polychaeton citri CBS 116435]|uniref:Bromodomain associated domain-containing protein n=1 Tax=Polychaeton citri CBS 116435 TaxID=1314669 RepID=A0A9P4QHP5_9PEZI|nr:hypothetical protein K431DRAFT_317894 [Polychaeton citri CBS 116435]